MSHWNSTEQPSYTLIERPQRDRAGLCLPKTSSSAIGAARLPSPSRHVASSVPFGNK